LKLVKYVFRDSTGLELPPTPTYDSKNEDTKKRGFFGKTSIISVTSFICIIHHRYFISESDEAESANFAENFEASLRTLNAKELMVHLEII